MMFPSRLQSIERKIAQDKIEVIQIFFIFILPIVLLYLNIISKHARVFVLIFMCLCIYGIIRHDKWTKEMLGLPSQPFHKYLNQYAIAALVGLFVIIGYAYVLGNTIQEKWWLVPHFWLIFIVVSFFQEFAYRSFLSVLLSRIIPNVQQQIFVNALLFTFLHVIYPNRLAMLPLAFVGGLFFAYLYKKYPNLILISLLHSVLNFTAVLYGFFVISGY